ncbi:MAG TPA: hypothetical protein VGR53_00530 [Nitrososphaerales archaeon]|nr:hypothetical protein [Nitrososphaerales archaeon]
MNETTEPSNFKVLVLLPRQMLQAADDDFADAHRCLQHETLLLDAIAMKLKGI